MSSSPVLENYASDASPAPLPVPPPHTTETYVLVPVDVTWGGPAWTDLGPPPADDQSGVTTIFSDWPSSSSDVCIL